MTTNDLKTTRFANTADINTFFKQLEASSFVDWFTKYHGDKDSFKNFKLTNESDFTKTFNDPVSLLENEDKKLGLYEFLTIFTLTLINTKSTFKTTLNPTTEDIDVRKSFAKYNLLSGNKTAFELFNDSDYIAKNETGGLIEFLLDSTDTRWQTDKFPIGFAHNPERENSKNAADNGFLTEADFYKFRPRGSAEIVGRTKYTEVLDILLNYTGDDATLKKYKDIWQLVNGQQFDKTQILTQSTNKQWDDLFTNSKITSLLLKTDSKESNNYLSIDSNSDEQTISKKISDIESKTGATGLAAKTKQLIDSINVQISSNSTSEEAPTNEDQPITETPEADEGTDNNDDSNGNTENDRAKGDGLNNSFEPTNKVNDIKFDLDTKNVDKAQEVTSTLGYKPFVWYNGIQIDDQYISSLTLFSTGLIPRLSIVFTDQYGIMTETAFPLDDTKIKIFINPKSPGLKEIMMEFKIESFKALTGDLLAIDAICDLNGLYLKKFESYSQKTSYETLQDLCKKIGLGFNSNIDNTSDKMTWINPGLSNQEFITHVITSAYKSDDAFLWCYIDFYYNLNFIDIETALKQDIKEQGNIQNLGLGSIRKFTDKKDSVTGLFLTNDKAHAQTNLYFSDYTVTNKSTRISIKDGYLNQVRFYDILDIEYLNFDVDSITSEGDKTIILKGAPGDNKFFSEHTITTYNGKLDKDNMHSNYNYATVQNQHNISQIQKIGMNITMPQPNFNLYRFQKVRITLVDDSPTVGSSQINGRLSGEWLIVDIKFVLSGDFIQTVSLIKRELEITPAEMAIENPQSDNNRTESGNNSTDDNNTNESETTPQTSTPITHDNVGKPFKYSIEFSSSTEIDDFFKQFDSGGYVGWYNKNHAGKGGFAKQGTKAAVGQIKKKENWTRVWNAIESIYGKKTCNMIEFLTINTIILNETGASFEPKTEGVGNSGNPGISYAFNKISGLKQSYNTLDGNKTNKSAYTLFRDPDYKAAHGTKPFNNLKDTTDNRWASSQFPVGFSGNPDKETSKNSADNSFISEADFHKFRGRGFIQLTNRTNYMGVIKYIMNYDGTNSKIKSYKQKWSSYGTNYDKIATISSNADWDDLFQNTELVIANASIYVHAKSKYQIIDPNQNDQNILKSVRNVAFKIAGGGAKDYADTFQARVYQQIDQLEKESK